MKYPIYQPYLTDNTKKYVNECIDSTWISSKGKFVEMFENMVSRYTERQYAVSVFNGTVALHLALLALNISKGDKVICPDFTYIASANAVRYVGGEPIFADVSTDDWNITIEEVKKIHKKHSLIKAIIVVDIYGQQPKDLEEISVYAKNNGIYIIQDSAESLGSKYKDKPIGEFADVTTLSFFGNKTITTGEGGMVLTDDKILNDKMRVLRNQGNSPDIRYFHEVLGYNFRMTNIQAAIGCSQMEIIEKILQQKQLIRDTYYKELSDLVKFQVQSNNIVSSNWLIAILVEGKVDILKNALEDNGIETRPFFIPVSEMPFYENALCKNSKYLSQNGICLPSYPGLEVRDVKYISRIIRDTLKE